MRGLHEELPVPLNQPSDQEAYTLWRHKPGDGEANGVHTLHQQSIIRGDRGASMFDFAHTTGWIAQ